MTTRLEDLQSHLRTLIWARIHQGQLTGTQLAREAGFQQAHLSNFLNLRRGLSVQAIDQLLDALGLDILDLVEPRDLTQRAGPDLLREPASLHIPLVPLHAAAHLPTFSAAQITEVQAMKKRFLRRLKPKLIGDRRHWVRFVLVRADSASIRAMAPSLGVAATLLIDRHYNSIEPYRSSHANVYAVRVGERCLIRYASIANNSRLVLLPHNREVAVPVLDIPTNRSYGDYIVGRVCQVVGEF